MTRPGRSRSVADGLRRVADHVGFALLWCWILASLFFVPTLLGYWWVGALLFVVGLLVCWQAAEASSDPVYTIGTKREVRTGRIESEIVDCNECGRSAPGGEYRRYERRRVLFGSTIAVLESGENIYCEDCAVAPRDRREYGRELEGGAPTAEDGDGDGSDRSNEKAAENDGNRSASTERAVD
ncbi:hypothetical protein [Halopiger xanaduensis]|uniref:DUF8108 domain-containing protein n=1 Tax=Halopiger xanaduensis (strain DSM 18323 / JCM 14033 / SH-6) TaxID=797210 RepID=F8DD20_HALXS|nr:hypothetical protein [Halopiger xanaduensis]AEH38494.1 hypothetical protein Halxa_3889 [Halopiger xanaduensis SH-6]